MSQKTKDEYSQHQYKHQHKRQLKRQDAGIDNAFNICGDYNASDPSSSCYLDCTELRHTCKYKKDETARS